MLGGCLVCVNCSSKYLLYDNSYIERADLQFREHLTNSFLLRSVERRYLPIRNAEEVSGLCNL